MQSTRTQANGDGFSEMNIVNVQGGWMAQWKQVGVRAWYALLCAFVVFLAVAPVPAVYAQAAGTGQGAFSISLRSVNMLPFMGPPSSVALDEELEALARAGGLDPGTSKALQSISGKQALWREIAGYIREQRSAIMEQALANYAINTAFGQGNAGLGPSSIFSPLISYASGIRPDLTALELELRRIARSLRGDSEVTARLREVLNRPGAVEAVYVSFLYPAYFAAGRVPNIENMLVHNALGNTVIVQRFRAKAKSDLERLAPMLATVDQLTGERIRDAARIAGVDTLHHGFKDALSDPLSTAIAAALRMRRDPHMTADQLYDAVTRQLNSKLSRSGDGIVLAKELSRGDAEENLKLLYRLRALALSNSNGLSALLGGLDMGDSLNRTFKAVMSTNLAAAALLSDDAFRPVPDVFYKSSVFGSSLVKESAGRWSINPHRKREMALAIAFLEQRLADYEKHREVLLKIAATSHDGGADQRLVAFTVLQMADMEILRDVKGLTAHWVDNHFEHDGKGYRVLQGKASQIMDIAKAETEAFSPLTVSLASSDYSNENTHLLRSSAYLFLRSKFARDVYFEEFEDHYAARLWGIFDWNAQEAKGPEAFRSALLKNKSFLQQIAATHEKVLIYVFHTPRWLSGSNALHQVDGRPAYLLHSPEDYDAWRDFVRESVRFLKQNLAGVDVYYEVWNEPEIYWLEGNKEYLRLYAETVAAIKREHPEAKVGGAAPNGWDGKAKGEHNGDAINLELIRHAARKRIPLDFISWHYFERPLSDLDAAKQRYHGELEKHGVKNVPEFVISEWSIPGRGSQNEAVAFAEYMLALYRSGVAIQTVAVWEEFTVQPRPKYLPPWGMLTNQGFKKPMFYVHAFFDRLSRNSEGIAVFESDDKRTKVVASRKGDGSYELVVWESRFSPPLEAALKTLREMEVATPDLKRYGSIEQLEKAIRDGKALKQEHSSAFRRSSEVYRDNQHVASSVSLRFAGAHQLRVTASEAVGVRSVGRQVFTNGPDLVANLPRSEIMWLRIEVD